MNASCFVCDFKASMHKHLKIKYQKCAENFYQNQRIDTKIKSAIDKRIKRQRNIEKHHTSTQEQLIEKLAQGIIRCRNVQRANTIITSTTATHYIYQWASNTTHHSKYYSKTFHVKHIVPLY